jgi:DNA polymerase-3 subunit gamma/tau
LQFLLGEEKIDTEAGALALISSAADGSMRDGLSLLDQAIAYGAGSVLQAAVESMLGAISKDYIFKLLNALVEQNASALIGEARNIIERNPDYQRVCAEMIALLQQIALFQSVAGIAPEDDSMAEHIAALSEKLSSEEIQLYYQIMLQGRHDLNISPDEASGFEMLMLRLLAFSPDNDSTSAQPSEKKSL